MESWVGAVLLRCGRQMTISAGVPSCCCSHIPLYLHTCFFKDKVSQCGLNSLGKSAAQLVQGIHYSPLLEWATIPPPPPLCEFWDCTQVLIHVWQIPEQLSYLSSFLLLKVLIHRTEDSCCWRTKQKSRNILKCKGKLCNIFYAMGN